MLSIVVSTLAFFVSAFLIKRKLEEMDIPAGMTRGALVFVLALFVSYTIGFIIDKIAG